MAAGDFQTVLGHFSIKPFAVKYGTTASINAGEPVVENTGADAEYVKAKAADIDSSDAFVGIAVSASSETVNTDGVVYVAMPTAGSVMRARAKTPTNLTTSVKRTRVIVDYTNGIYKLDESTTDKGFCLITDYSSDGAWVDFIIDVTYSVNP